MHTGVWGKVGAAVLPLVTIAGVLALWQGQYVKFNLNTVRLHKLGLQKMAAQHAQLTVARPQLPPSPVPQQKLSVTQIPASSIKVGQIFNTILRWCKHVSAVSGNSYPDSFGVVPKVIYSVRKQRYPLDSCLTHGITLQLSHRPPTHRVCRKNPARSMVRCAV